MQDTYIIIPVYNEATVIAGVVTAIQDEFPNIVCVNDGSKDASSIQIANTRAKLVNHPINLGQGAAIQTGIDFALQDPKAKYFVTFDADGQHSIDDVRTMIKYLRKHQKTTDIVLGSRFLGVAKNMNRTKKWILKLAVVFSNVTTGLKLTDAHNGLRVFNRHVAENMRITMPDMAHASEITHRIKDQNFRYKELPVTITYTDYSKSKGQPIMNSINITFDLWLHRMSKK